MKTDRQSISLTSAFARVAERPQRPLQRFLQIVLAIGTLAAAGHLLAQETAVPEVPAAQLPSADLAASQARVAKRYAELQQALLKMAEVTASTDPRRAALLRQAFTRSNELGVEQKLQGLVELLERDQLYLAQKDQVQLQQDLARLLEILLSGDRDDKLPDEKARMAALLKQVNRLIKDQKGVQGQTDSDRDPAQLAQKQAEVTDKTHKLREEIEKSDHANQAKSNAPNQNQSSPDGKQPQDRDAPDGPGPSSEPKAGEQDQREQLPMPSSPSDGGDVSPQSPDPMQVNQPKSGEPAEQTPGRHRLSEAEKRMKAAEEQLERAEKKQAFEEQQRAIEELEMAKAELEKILRQLREEEIDRVLTMLEARFRKMLAMQTEVYEGTQRLLTTESDQRTREDEIESGRLGRREAEIIAEADRALTLMREDGTAVAFPEALVQIRSDMQQISEQLISGSASDLTIGLEQDVLASLEETLAALEKAKQDQKQERNQQAQSQVGEPSEPPLVDQLSELKMIRTLQLRVNNRTVQYSKLLENSGADQAQLRSGLDELARRQARIHSATRDIVTGKNK